MGIVAMEHTDLALDTWAVTDSHTVGERIEASFLPSKPGHATTFAWRFVAATDSRIRYSAAVMESVKVSRTCHHRGLQCQLDPLLGCPGDPCTCYNCLVVLASSTMEAHTVAVDTIAIVD